MNYTRFVCLIAISLIITWSSHLTAQTPAMTRGVSVQIGKIYKRHTSPRSRHGRRVGRHRHSRRPTLLRRQAGLFGGTNGRDEIHASPARPESIYQSGRACSIRANRESREHRAYRFLLRPGATHQSSRGPSSRKIGRSKRTTGISYRSCA